MSARGTASQELARWITELTYDAIPGQVRADIRDGVINSIGTAIGGSGLPSVAHALTYATEQAAGGGPATVFVQGRRMSCSGAAFVNAVMVNALAQEETHRSTGIHPIETTLPVLLACAEERGSSGEEFLVALVAGVEVAVALAAMSLTPEVKYDACQAPAVYGTLGGAAAVCKLWQLNADQTANALGLAANFAAGLSECIRQGTGEFHYLKGLAATHAHLAASLAAADVPCAPTALEGDGGFFHLFAQVSREALARHDVAGELAAGLGHRWGTSELIYKPYPVFYFNQVFVDGALSLRSRHGIDADKITSISLEVGQRAVGSGASLQPPFARRENALGSTTFCVAAALARGRVTLAEISEGTAPDILRLARRTTVVESSEPLLAKIRITVDDAVHEFDGLVEGPDYHLTGPAVHELFHTAASSALTRQRRDDLLAVLLDLDGLGDMGKVVELTVAP